MNTLWLRLLARLLLGGVFLVLSLDKLRYPRIFGEAIAGYDIIPPLWIPSLSLSLPWLEFWVGLTLVLGFYYRASALLLGLLSVGFSLMISTALWRGLDISCGCFRESAWSALGSKHLAFDLCLAMLAAAIYRWGPGPFSLDRWRERRKTVRSENGQTASTYP